MKCKSTSRVLCDEKSLVKTGKFSSVIRNKVLVHQKLSYSKNKVINEDVEMDVWAILIDIKIRSE